MSDSKKYHVGQDDIDRWNSLLAMINDLYDKISKLKSGADWVLDGYLELIEVGAVTLGTAGVPIDTLSDETTDITGPFSVVTIGASVS